MKLFKLLLLILLLNVGFSAAVFAQRDTMALTSIVEKTQNYAYNHPVEKVYVHFDKPYYAVGDTIWFKAYVTYALHQPTQISKVVYLDMLDSKDSLVASLKMPVNNGVAWGNITLPQLTFKQGNYHVMAYTKWMRNSDPSYFFNKTIPVGSNVEGQVLSKIAFSNDVTDNSAKINATIVYKDETGAPYADKKVSWKAMLDDQTLAKGKGTTDQNGRITITYASDKLSNLSPGNIVSSVDVTNKKTVTNTFPVSLADKTDDIQFFPEGGELLTGVRSRVAFKAIKPDGLGVELKGTVVDNAGNTVIDFASTHLGMGVFAFQPEAGKTYKANVTFADGAKGSFNLPRIRSTGISLSVDNSDVENLQIKISTNQAFLDKNQGQPVYIMGQSGQVVCFAAKTLLPSAVYSATISKSKFPTGIAQLTLFSSKGEPLSERIVFIQHNDQLTLNLNSERKLYGARQKVKIGVSAKNGIAPVEGNFSITVVDESKVVNNDDAETTILSSLLLTSDLRGYVEQPSYYFNHHDNAAADLDVLMMTQGYRRFSYKNILADKVPPFYFLPEQGIEVSGTLRLTTGVPVNKGNIRLLIPDKNYSTEATTDVDGRFMFDKLSFKDSTEVTVTARGNIGGKNMMVTLNNEISQMVAKNVTAPDEVFNVDSLISPYLQNAKHQYANSQILKEVVVRAAPVVKRASHLDYPSLAGLSLDPDDVLRGERLKGCAILLNCLGGGRLTYDNGQLYITRVYNGQVGGQKLPVQVMYNGMQVDVSYLNTLRPEDVESVEIFQNDGLSGINRMTNTSGVVVVNGKKPMKIDDKDKTKISYDQLQDMIASQQNTLKVRPRGYNFGREFYSPKYEAGKPSSVGIDLRSTIYWNPHVTTDKTGNTSVEFYNADGRGNYKAIIEGFDNEGNLGRYIYRYKVQ